MPKSPASLCYANTLVKKNEKNILVIAHGQYGLLYTHLLCSVEWGKGTLELIIGWLIFVLTGHTKEEMHLFFTALLLKTSLLISEILPQ